MPVSADVPGYVAGVPTLIPLSSVVCVAARSDVLVAALVASVVSVVSAVLQGLSSQLHDKESNYLSPQSK